MEEVERVKKNHIGEAHMLGLEDENPPIIRPTSFCVFTETEDISGWDRA